MSILLHFAYRKEAQFFIKEWNLSPLRESSVELFHSNDFSKFVLITGEGIDNTLILGTRALAYLEYKLNIQPALILNLGIAGALKSTLSINELVCPKIAIRSNIVDTAYFQSFELAKLPSSNDLSLTEIFAAVSADKRINQLESKSKLEEIGDIVDRELWAIADVSMNYKIPCASIKIISDFALENSCSLALDNADELSLKLYQSTANYIENIFSHKKEIELQYTKNQNIFEPAIFKNPNFYFTQTQKHQLKKLYLGHKIKKTEDESELLNNLEVLEILQNNSTPKKRASELLFHLYEKLNPFLVKHQRAIKEILKPLDHHRLSFDLDQKLEDETLRLHLEIANEQDFKELKNALSQFDYVLFRDLVFGKELES